MPDAPAMRLYSELAPWWPIFSAPADYAEEAAFYLRQLVAGAFITGRSVIDRILAHLRQRRETPRPRAPPARRTRNAGTPAHA